MADRRVIEGNKQITKERFGIVVSRYNETITDNLLAGALATLATHGATEDHVFVARVPGAWELPIAAQRLLESGEYAAVLCLGAVIKGETTHDTYINWQVSRSLGQLALDHKTPVLFGLLTCQTIEQAKNRSRPPGSADSRGRFGNKGSECAEAAVEIVTLLRDLD